MDPFKVNVDDHFGLDRHLDLIKELELNGRTRRSQRLAGFVNHCVQYGIQNLKKQIGPRRVVSLNQFAFRKISVKKIK